MENKLSKTQEVLEPTTDLCDIDFAKIEDFKERGLPGIAKVDDHSLTKMMNLYLDGKPYTQIARVVRMEKALVMYLSNKFGWYTVRKEYLHELEATIRNRVVESKVISQDFLLQLTQFWQKRIGDNIAEYIRTGDKSHADNVNLKEVDKYLKTVEMLHKITSSSPNATKPPQAPTVGLNLGDGVTIKKVGENEVEVTPKQKTVGDMLKQFADFRRVEATNKEAESKDKKENKNEDEQ